MTAASAWSVVVPTIGRPQLGRLLASLAAQRFDSCGPPDVVVLVDDRPAAAARPQALPVPERLPVPVRVLRTGGRGPAAARNAGWRTVRTPWVAFLDDDVELPVGWGEALAADLAAADADVAATQARLRVPLPADRPPLDWERNTAGLESARWATADLAVRRAALVEVAGFDERFPRAYREDADLALRLRRAGWRLVRGDRSTVHPVRPADDRVSVRVQAGAADDALMRALHGPRWRELAETGHGRFGWHVATVTAATVACGALLAGRSRSATAAGTAWLGFTADFARRRIAPGPRPGQRDWAPEWRRMLWTSVVIPFAAVRHRVAGTLAHRGGVEPWPVAVRAVLFDRDGTLVHDVPDNGDPDLVRPVAGAREVLDALRAAGVAVGLVTNQSGIARGVLTSAQVAAVHRRIAVLLGPFADVQVCPHGTAAGCACRKPEPGMLLAAARRIGVPPAACGVVGDIGADVEAAVAAGMRAVLVPTAATRPQEVADATVVATDLRSAVACLVPGCATGTHDTRIEPSGEPSGTPPTGPAGRSAEPDAEHAA